MINEDPNFLGEWFEYDTASPSCLKWKKRSPHGRRGAGDHITYLSQYYQVKLHGNIYKCHRIILILHGLMPKSGEVADHINRDCTDNRIENLRWVTISQNNSNRVVLASPGFKYTRRAPSGRFRAQYRCPLTKRTVNCGTHDSAYTAHLEAITHKLQHSWNP